MSLIFPRMGFGTTIIPPSITVGGHPVNTAGQSSYIFSGVNIGAADPSRFLVVHAEYGSGLSSFITIDDTDSLNQLSTGGTRATFHGIAWPTGTSANLTLELDGTSSYGSIQVFSLYNLASTTPTAFNFANSSTGGSAISCNVNTLSGGIAIGCIICASSSNRTFTWSGLTEQTDETVDSGTATHGSAIASGTSTETPRSISVTVSGSTTNGATINTISFA